MKTLQRLWHGKPRFVLCAMAWILVAAPAVATPLDDYVAAPDASFGWNLAATVPGPGFTAYVLDMTSQTWRSSAEVDRPVWQHYLTIVRPNTVTSSRAMLYVDGGDNTGSIPGISPELVSLALGTGTVVADLRTVPNQVLRFTDETISRREDAIIAYSWDKLLRGGDSQWPLQLPMTKSAVRAMDSVQQFLATPAGGSTSIQDFVVSGASKRGWTTWLTAAVDPRVKAIAPIVIDVLNIEPSLNHHYDSYGFWAPALNDYVAMGITNWRGTPELRSLFDIVDPYVYRDRLTMPKFAINSAGDDFFLPDSSQFYFDDLVGPKYLRYVPNTNHSLGGSDAAESWAAFYQAQITGAPLPEFTWTLEADGRLRVDSPLDDPMEVRLWQATNASARDFRQSEIGNAYTSTLLTDAGGGVFIGDVPRPAAGWTAYFIEMTYPSGGLYDYKFTTSVYVVGVPEPGSVVLLLMGGAVAIVLGRRGQFAARRTGT